MWNDLPKYMQLINVKARNQKFHLSHMTSLATVKPQQYGPQEVDILLSSSILLVT